MTKLYQESKFAPLSELIDYYTQNPARGEIVLSISGKGNQIITEDILKSELQDLLSSGSSAKSASDAVFAKYKSQYSRKEIYNLANGLKSV